MKENVLNKLIESEISCEVSYQQGTSDYEPILKNVVGVIIGVDPTTNTIFFRPNEMKINVKDIQEIQLDLKD